MVVCDSDVWWRKHMFSLLLCEVPNYGRVTDTRNEWYASLEALAAGLPFHSPPPHRHDTNNVKDKITTRNLDQSKRFRKITWWTLWRKESAKSLCKHVWERDPIWGINWDIPEFRMQRPTMIKCDKLRDRSGKSSEYPYPLHSIQGTAIR